MTSRLKKWEGVFFAAMCLGSFLIVGCSKPKTPPPAKTEEAKQQAGPIMSPDEPPAPSNGMVLPTSFGRRTGDLDEMVKRRNIRALVILNPIGFFYDKGQPRGVMYEALDEFQKFANKKLNTGKLNVKVTFLPMRVDQIEAALTEGVGDMIASGIVVTPDREKRVAFSTPLQTDVSQIIVTRPDFGTVSSLADLGGKEVYANPLTTYYENLQKVNEQQNAAASPINVANVATADGNIHAGVKMLRNIGDNYFNDPKIDSVNKTLFVFASYNAGPNRIARLRKKASDMGLDPNVWFGNVELVAAEDMGRRPSLTFPTFINTTSHISWRCSRESSERRQKGCPADLLGTPQAERALASEQAERSNRNQISFQPRLGCGLALPRLSLLPVEWCADVR